MDAILDRLRKLLPSEGVEKAEGDGPDLFVHTLDGRTFRRHLRDE